MSVEEIEQAIRSLGEDEFARIADRVHALEQERWDAEPGMNSHAIPRFWRLFHGLPPEAQRLAVKTFRL